MAYLVLVLHTHCTRAHWFYISRAHYYHRYTHTPRTHRATPQHFATHMRTAHAPFACAGALTPAATTHCLPCRQAYFCTHRTATLRARLPHAACHLRVCTGRDRHTTVLPHRYACPHTDAALHTPYIPAAVHAAHAAFGTEHWDALYTLLPNIFHRQHGAWRHTCSLTRAAYALAFLRRGYRHSVSDLRRWFVHSRMPSTCR